MWIWWEMPASETASTASLEGENAQNKTFLSQKDFTSFTTGASSSTVKGIVGVSVHVPVHRRLQGY